jgi:hypothetical protein
MGATRRRLLLAVATCIAIACRKAEEREPAAAVQVTLKSTEVCFGAVYHPPLPSLSDAAGVEKLSAQGCTSYAVSVPPSPRLELCVFDYAGLCTNEGFRSLIDQIEPLGLRQLYMFCGGRGLDPRIAIGEVGRLTSLESLSIDLSNAMGGVMHVESWRDGPSSGSRLVHDEPIGLTRWAPLRNLKRLAILGIGPGCGIRSCDDEVRALVANHPQLEELRLANFGGLTDAGLEAVSRLRNLRLFSLEEGFLLNQGASDSLHPRITDEGIAHLRQLADLRVLYLQGCDQVGDSSLSTMAQLEKLEVIAIEMNSRVTSRGLSHLTRLPQLRSLSLYKCHQLDDAGLEIVASIPTLLELDVKKCPSITSETLARLRRESPQRVINSRGGTSSPGPPPLGRRF